MSVTNRARERREDPAPGRSQGPLNQPQLFTAWTL